MEEQKHVFDVLGNKIIPGDTIVQYRGYSRNPAIGTVLRIIIGRDGNTRLVADGDFKRAFLPRKLLNISYLGIPMNREMRPIDYSVEFHEFNRNHIEDALGYEARIHDNVLFWNTANRISIGTIRSFSSKGISIIVQPLYEDEVVWHAWAEHRHFIIFDTKLPISDELLYREKKRIPKAKSVINKAPHKDNHRAAIAFANNIVLLYGEREAGTITEVDYQGAVDDLIAEYRLAHKTATNKAALMNLTT